MSDRSSTLKEQWADWRYFLGYMTDGHTRFRNRNHVGIVRIPWFSHPWYFLSVACIPHSSIDMVPTHHSLHRGCSHALAGLTYQESASLVQVLVRSAHASSTQTAWWILMAPTQCARHAQPFAMLSAKILLAIIWFLMYARKFCPMKINAIW